ncbi:hypothetical protein [Moraxella ovis]|nr:hypothetical protein [Moraxella ovis]
MNHSLQTDRLGFVELAKLAMQMVDKPMTASDLWQFVLQNDLHHQLKTFDV